MARKKQLTQAEKLQLLIGNNPKFAPRLWSGVDLKSGMRKPGIMTSQEYYKTYEARSRAAQEKPDKKRDNKKRLDELLRGEGVSPSVAAPRTNLSDDGGMRERLLDSMGTGPGTVGNLLPLAMIGQAGARKARPTPTGENRFQEAIGDILGRPMTEEEMLRRMESADSQYTRNENLASRLASSRYATQRGPRGIVSPAESERFLTTGTLRRPDVIQRDVGTSLLGNGTSSGAAPYYNEQVGSFDTSMWGDNPNPLKRVWRGIWNLNKNITGPATTANMLLRFPLREGETAGEWANRVRREDPEQKFASRNAIETTAQTIESAEGDPSIPQIAASGPREWIESIRGSNQRWTPKGQVETSPTFSDVLRAQGSWNPFGGRTETGMATTPMSPWVRKPLALASEVTLDVPLDFGPGAKAGANILRKAGVEGAQELNTATKVFNAAKSQLDDIVENTVGARPETLRQTIQGVRAIRQIPELAPDAQRGAEEALLALRRAEEARRAIMAGADTAAQKTVRQVVEEANDTALQQALDIAAQAAAKNGDDVQAAVQRAGAEFKAPYRMAEIEADFAKRFGDTSALDRGLNTLDNTEQAFAKRAIGRAADDYSFLNFRMPLASSSTGFALPGTHYLSRGLGDVLTAGGRSAGALDVIRGARFLKDVPFVGSEASRLRNEYGAIKGDVVTEAKRQYLTRSRMARAEAQRQEHQNMSRLIDGLNVPPQEKNNLLASMGIQLDDAGNIKTVKEVPFSEVADLSEAKRIKNRVGIRTMNADDIRLLDYEPVHQQMRDNGGITIDLATGQPVDLSDGYMVSRPSKNVPVDDEKVDAKKLHDYVIRLSKRKDTAGAYAGGWPAEGKWYFDISDKVDSKDEAIARGLKNKQLAIWDNASGEEIPLTDYYVKGDPKKGLNQKHPEYTVLRERIAALGSKPQVDVEAQQAGRDFSRFFTGAAKGEYAPEVPWSPIGDISDVEDALPVYAKHESGQFSEHIATSIPTFRENQIRKAKAIAAALGGDPGAKIPGKRTRFPKPTTMLDIGGSEGGFGKTVAELSNGSIEVDILDPNAAMREVFESGEQVPGVKYIEEGFGMKDDYVDPKTGEVTKAWKSNKRYDIVHESMGFQFFSKNRAQDVQQVKAHLNPGGVAFFEEKFIDPDPAVNAANEAAKDAYKLTHFTPEQASKKMTEVVEGMQDYQARLDKMQAILEREFGFVEQYWEAGNFKGFIASDSDAGIAQFMEEYGGPRRWDGALPEGAVPVPSKAKPGKVMEVKSRIGSRVFPKRVPGEPLQPSDIAEPEHFTRAREEQKVVWQDMIDRTRADIDAGRMADPEARAIAEQQISEWQRMIDTVDETGWLYHTTDVSPEELRRSGGLQPQKNPYTDEPILFSRPWQVGQTYGDNEYRFPTNAAFNADEFAATIDPFDTITRRGISPDQIQVRNQVTGEWEPLLPVEIQRSALPAHVKDALEQAGVREDGTRLYYSAMLGQRGSLRQLADRYESLFPGAIGRTVDEQWDIATASEKVVEQMTSGKGDEERLAARIINKLMRRTPMSETMAQNSMEGVLDTLDNQEWVAERIGMLQDIIEPNNREAQQLAREFGWSETMTKGNPATRMPRRPSAASRILPNARTAESLLGIEPERGFMGRIKKPRASHQSPELMAENERMFKTLRARLEAGYETELNPVVASGEDLLDARLRGINEESRGIVGQATGRPARMDANGNWRYADTGKKVPADELGRAQKSGGNAFIPETRRRGTEVAELTTDWGVNQKGNRNEVQDVADAVSQSLIASMTVMRPAFQAINELGNLWNMLTMGELSTEAFAQSAKAVKHMLTEGGGTAKGVVGEIPIAGRMEDLSTFLTEAMEVGAISPLEFNPATVYREGADAGLYNVPLIGKYLELMRTSNSVLENQSRLAVYIKARNEGLDAMSARDVVNDTVYDYELNSLNRGEQWLRQYLPFFTFSRRNLPAQVELLLTRPYYRNFAANVLETLDTEEGSWTENRDKNMQYQNEQGLNVHMGLPESLGGEAVVGFRPPLGDALTTLNSLRALSQGKVGTAAAGLIGEQMNPGFQATIGTLTNTTEQGANLDTAGGFANYLLNQTPIVGGALSATRREKKPAAFGGDPLAMERFLLSQMTGISTRNYNPYYSETQRQYELGDALAAELAWRRKRKETPLEIKELESKGWRTPR